MPEFIVRLADNEYAEYSSVVDSLTSYIATRDEAVAEWGADRIERCDKSNITSEYGYPNQYCKDVESYLCFNRCKEWEKRFKPRRYIDENGDEGYDYSMTLDEIRLPFKDTPNNREIGKSV